MLYHINKKIFFKVTILSSVFCLLLISCGYSTSKNDTVTSSNNIEVRNYVDGIEGFSLEQVGLSINHDAITKELGDNSYTLRSANDMKGDDSIAPNDDNLKGNFSVIHSYTPYECQKDSEFRPDGKSAYINFLFFQAFEIDEINAGKKVNINFKLYDKTSLEKYMVYKNDKHIVYELLPLITELKSTDYYAAQTIHTLNGEICKCTTDANFDWVDEARKNILMHETICISS